MLPAAAAANAYRLRRSTRAFQPGVDSPFPGTVRACRSPGICILVVPMSRKMLVCSACSPLEPCQDLIQTAQPRLQFCFMARLGSMFGHCHNDCHHLDCDFSCSGLVRHDLNRATAERSSRPLLASCLGCSYDLCTETLAPRLMMSRRYLPGQLEMAVMSTMALNPSRAKGRARTRIPNLAQWLPHNSSTNSRLRGYA
jgi:hypothetical protein